MSKYCKYCWELNENPLLKFCRICYPKFWKKLAKTKINAVSDKKKQRLEVQWWELDMFYRKIDQEIQEKWEIRCQNPKCNRKLQKEQLNQTSFAHILSKGMYPQYRYFLNNIAIVCPSIAMDSCHTKIDSLVSWNKLEIEKEIINGNRIDFNKYRKW